jgi:hypothetical protein
VPPVSWFQSTEQSLMDAIGSGNRAAWQRVLDPTFLVTTEEGQIQAPAALLAGFRPFPPGITGAIAVRDLTVEGYGDFAVVRFVADETETVFGQALATKYRVTDTWRRDGADWKIVASQLSVMTQDPPAQEVSTTSWPGFVGTYQLQPSGWTFAVELRDGKLWGGRNPKKLQPFVPVAPNVFVLSGSLGEWIFVADESGKATRIVELRKLEPLVWTRVTR